MKMMSLLKIDSEHSTPYPNRITTLRACVFSQASLDKENGPNRASTSLSDSGDYELLDVCQLSSEVETFAAEWLEIGRTLAENASLVNEMSLDLREKKVMLERCSRQLVMLQKHCSARSANKSTPSNGCSSETQSASLSGYLEQKSILDTMTPITGGNRARRSCSSVSSTSYYSSSSSPTSSSSSHSSCSFASNCWLANESKVDNWSKAVERPNGRSSRATVLLRAETFHFQRQHCPNSGGKEGRFGWAGVRGKPLSGSLSSDGTRTSDSNCTNCLNQRNKDWRTQRICRCWSKPKPLNFAPTNPDLSQSSRLRGHLVLDDCNSSQQPHHHPLQEQHHHQANTSKRHDAVRRSKQHQNSIVRSEGQQTSQSIISHNGCVSSSSAAAAEHDPLDVAGTAASILLSSHPELHQLHSDCTVTLARTDATGSVEAAASVSYTLPRRSMQQLNHHHRRHHSQHRLHHQHQHHPRSASLQCCYYYPHRPPTFAESVPTTASTTESTRRTSNALSNCDPVLVDTAAAASSSLSFSFSPSTRLFRITDSKISEKSLAHFALSSHLAEIVNNPHLACSNSTSVPLVPSLSTLHADVPKSQCHISILSATTFSSLTKTLSATGPDQTLQNLSSLQRLTDNSTKTCPVTSRHLIRVQKCSSSTFDGDQDVRVSKRRANQVGENSLIKHDKKRFKATSNQALSGFGERKRSEKVVPWCSSISEVSIECPGTEHHPYLLDVDPWRGELTLSPASSNTAPFLLQSASNFDLEQPSSFKCTISRSLIEKLHPDQSVTSVVLSPNQKRTSQRRCICASGTHYSYCCYYYYCCCCACLWYLCTNSHLNTSTRFGLNRDQTLPCLLSTYWSPFSAARSTCPPVPIDRAGPGQKASLTRVGSRCVSVSHISPTSQTKFDKARPSHSHNSASIFVRLRALTQLLLMSHSFKQFIASDEVQKLVTNEREHSVNTLGLDTNILLQSTPQFHPCTSDRENLVEPVVVSHKFGDTPRTHHREHTLQGEKMETGNLFSCSSAENEKSLNEDEDKAQPTRPKTLGLFRSGIGSVSLSSSKKPSFPTVTRSSSSAACPPPAEYFQHHRPSVPNVVACETDSSNSSPVLGSSPVQSTIENVGTPKPPIPHVTSVLSTSPPMASSVAELSCKTVPRSTTTRSNNFGRFPFGIHFSNAAKGQQILKYSKKKLRGPYGEMLESKMRSSDQFNKKNDMFEPIHSIVSPPNEQSISFIDELLRQTKDQRSWLDQNSKEAMGTNILGFADTKPSQTSTETPSTDSQPTYSSQVSELEQSTKVAEPKEVSENSDKLSPEQPAGETTTQVPTDIEEEEEMEEEGDKKDTKAENESNSLTKTTPQETEPSITATIGRHLDTRTHVVGELYDTEKTYCGVLKTLHENYMGRLSISELDGLSLSTDIKSLENIVKLMPVPLEVHSKFLEQLRRRIANWCPEQTKIGDLFDCFSKRELVQFYLDMSEHMNDIRTVLKHNSSLHTNKNGSHKGRTLEIKRGKFTLDDLLISIIQRVTRYEMLLKRLMKHTKSDHEDYFSLKQALNIIHDLLIKINAVPNAPAGTENGAKENCAESTGSCAPDATAQNHSLDTSTRQLYVRDLETVIEGAQSLLDQYKPNSLVHLYDYVTIRKREKAIFVLDVCILLCQVKSKKKSEKFEYNKFKLQQTISLENVELRCQCWQHQVQVSGRHQSLNTLNSVPGSDMTIQSTSTSCSVCGEIMERDMQLLLIMQNELQKISTLAIRKSIEKSIREQLQSLVIQLSEINETIARCERDCSVDLYILSESDRRSVPNFEVSMQSPTDKDERLVHYKCAQHQPSVVCGEPEYSITFGNSKKREDFEHIVTNLRTKIFKSRFNLKFLCQLPYQKAPLGLQFTCALPTIGTNDIWICKSDGFVGQISVLSMDNLDEPTLVSCNSVCNSRIVCLKAVPSFSSINGNVDSGEYLSDTSRVLHQLSSGTTTSPARTISVKGSSPSHYSCVDMVEDSDGANESEIETSNVKTAKSVDPSHRAEQSSNWPNKSSYMLQHLKSPKGSKIKCSTPPNTFPFHSTSVLSPDATSPPPMPPTDNAEAFYKQQSSRCATIESTIQDASIFASSSPQVSIAPIPPYCPTMWFGTDDSTINIYSCFDAVRIRKNKAKVTLSSKIESIEYFKERVLVGLANHTVAVFTRDSTGHWLTTPVIVEGVHCHRFCVVNQDYLWTSSQNILQIRNEDLKPIEEPIHVKDIDEISFIVANHSVYVASLNSSYIYRYSHTAPYHFLSSISIGPSVHKALSLSEDIIRLHKNACLRVCTMHVVQDRILIGTSAGVILVLDDKNTLEIIPKGHTGYVRFITSIKLKNGKFLVVSGGDGYEQFSLDASGNLTGSSDMFQFMSYCSNLAHNLLGRSSSNSNMLATAAAASTVTTNSTAAAAVSAMATASAVPGTGVKFNASNSSTAVTSTGHDADSPDPNDSMASVSCCSKKDCFTEDAESHLLIWKFN